MYSVLKSVWKCVCLVSIVNDLKTCSTCLVTKATLLAWDLFQVCSRSKLLLWNHITWWQNFFFKCNFSISQYHIYHIKDRDFPGSEHPKEHTMNSVGTCHQEFYRMLCTSLDSSVPRGTDSKFPLLLGSVTSFALKKFKPGTSIYSHTCGLPIKTRAV